MSDHQPKHVWISPQNLLRVIGAGLVIQGLLFFAFAAPLTEQIFPGAGDEREYLVAIDDLALFIADDDAVRIAV